MRLVSRSWLSEILLNTTKNIFQQLDSIIHRILNYSYPVKNAVNLLKSMRFIFQQLGPNLGSAGQYSHERSLFVALLSRLTFLELNERAIELQLRPS